MLEDLPILLPLMPRFAALAYGCCIGVTSMLEDEPALVCPPNMEASLATFFDGLMASDAVCSAEAVRDGGRSGWSLSTSMGEAEEGPAAAFAPP